jgi:hypothetical protein
VVIKRFIELENGYFMDKPQQGHPMWEAILMCWFVKVIKPKNQKEYRQRKRWIHSVKAPTKRMMESEVAKFSRRRDVKLLK